MSTLKANQGELSGLLKSKSFGEKKARSLEKLAGMPPNWLDSDEPEKANVLPAPIGTRRIPLISYVQAGHMAEAVDSYPVGSGAEWILTDLELSPTAFALKIKGDSMLPEFREGDTVIIDPSVQPLPGDFVVAKNGEHEATFKKYRPRGHDDHGDTVFELVPLNEDYPSTRSDVTPVRIIGTMVEHRRYRKR
jgi:SOS-response transcriptional repressor LexA